MPSCVSTLALAAFMTSTTLLCACAGSPGVEPAQSAAPVGAVTPAAALAGNADEPAILLTIFLRHDQSKTLDDLSKQLETTGFYAAFPPAGVRIESWKVVMGVGQVVTLRVPPARLREVNRAIERTAWGAFRTEFYPTYDFLPIAAELRAKQFGTPATP